MNHSDARERSVVIGGAGQVGRLFTELLSGAGAVTVIDPRARPGSAPAGVRLIAEEAGGPRAATRAALAAAGTVVLALPESAALAVVAPVAAAMGPGALLVDTLSVKTAIAERVLVLAARHGLEALGVNPMFGPALGFPGRPVAAVPLRPGARTDRFLALLAGAGARVVRLDAGRHDRAVASMQAATHAAVLAFGQALAVLGPEADVLVGLAPPPHLVMLALLARICSGEPEVYWDVQAGNPLAERARTGLADGLARLSAVIGRADEAGFRALLAETGGFLGPHREELAARCAALFDGPGLR
ncbi:prephenate dehydrogenase/arogenate dehydrogenase family protein [Kitasatospora sp. NPDC056446]|uniref:prephenate dehydrogenase/arogenate dehydrogenase family protein n=1 Tax=Kitasatospora sp. NPDC056446 TaxID=3345819 RepID=UPI003677E51F